MARLQDIDLEFQPLQFVHPKISIGIKDKKSSKHCAKK